MKSLSFRIKEFLKSAIAERRKLIYIDESRISWVFSLKSCSEIERYINNYEYTDLQAAKFLIRKQGIIRFILPGNGSFNKEARFKNFLELLQESYDIIKMEFMKETFYHISDPAGEAYVKNWPGGCVIIKRYYDGRSGIEKFDHPYKRQPDQIITQITKSRFQNEFNRAQRQLVK